MNKRILSLITVISMLISMVTAVIAAEAEGDFTFTVADGKATITAFNKNYIGVVNIPTTLKNYPVTAISQEAFKDCPNITKVTIPAGITSIEKSTFQNCTSLTEVTIPNTVKTIGDNAFQGCKSLTTVDMPNSVTSIGRYAFANCVLLKNITLKEGLVIIDDYAFQECDGLTNVIIPNSVTIIRDGVFNHCSGLKDVILSCNMTSISAKVFSQCGNLSNVTIPKSIISIGNNAYAGSTGWYAVTVRIQNIYYEGNENDWANISIGTGNAGLLDATIHYNSAMPNPVPDTVTPAPVVTITPVPDTVTPAPVVTITPAPVIVTPAPVSPAPTEANSGTTTVINNTTTNTVITNNTTTNNNITNNTTTNNNIENNTNITNNITNTLVLYIGKTTASVGGQSVENDVAPIVRNDRTMLPARFVAENLGATVEWDGNAKQVKITKGDKIITITIGSDKAYVNGAEQTLDSPAFVENDRTYTPVRFIAESLDANVDWNGEAQSVTITK